VSKCIILTTKHVIKRINTSNQLIFMVELLSFKINEVYIKVRT